MVLFMRRKKPIWLMLSLTFVITLSLFLFAEYSSGVYRAGDTLPAHLESALPIVGLEYSADQRGYPLTLRGVGGRSLALVFSNARQFALWQDGTIIHTQSEAGRRAKNTVVSLRPANDETHILIEGEAAQNSAPHSCDKINILITSTELAQEKLLFTHNWSLVALGMLATMALFGFSLYKNKPSEGYLLHVVVGAVLNFFNLALPLNLLGIQISASADHLLRPVLLIACAGQMAYLVIGFYKDALPKAFIRYLNLRNMLVILLVASLWQVLSSLSIYNILRLCLCIPVFYTLERARRQNMHGATLILIAYTAAETIILCVYLVHFIRYPMGSFSALWRSTEVMQCLLMLCIMVVINNRFAEKFSMAQTLTIQLQEMNDTLENRVQERTSQLKDQQQRRYAMMQNIFHDVRSPIYVLKAQLSQLPRLPENQPAVDKMEKRLRYLDELVSDLFLLSKLESGHLLLDEGCVSMKNVCSEVYDALSGKAENRGIRSQLCAAQTCLVWGDELRLTQMIQNLMENAIFHTPSGGQIHLRTRQEDKQVIIEVSNTGSRIPEEELQMVFMRYYRSERSHNPHSSGLGLSIAKEIAEVHDGSISVASTPQHTVFTVSLPLLNLDDNPA